MAGPMQGGDPTPYKQASGGTSSPAQRWQIGDAKNRSSFEGTEEQFLAYQASAGRPPQSPTAGSPTTAPSPRAATVPSPTGSGSVSSAPTQPSASPAMAGLQAGQPRAPLDALGGGTSGPLRADLGQRQPPSLQALLQGLRY